MLFKATFKNISVISWKSVLLVEDTVVPGLKQVTDKLYHIMWTTHRVNYCCLMPNEQFSSYIIV